MIKPISPNDVVSAKENLLPDFVIDTFNKLIALQWDGRKSQFTSKEAKRVMLSHPMCINEDSFTSAWLDVEDIYRDKGWKVTYDKPAYNETYDGFYVFEK